MVLLARAAFALAAMTVVSGVSAQSVRLLVQSSPLAGFRHHEAPSAFEDMRVGDALVLAREPDNPHDASAVRVEFEVYVE